MYKIGGTHEDLEGGSVDSMMKSMMKSDTALLPVQLVSRIESRCPFPGRTGTNDGMLATMTTYALLASLRSRTLITR
jgi:hypothetical protein